MTLEPGLEAAFRYTVTEADTAAAVGSGDVPVLATPRVLALAERATVAAVAGALAAGATMVGARVELDHLAPSPVGAGLDFVAEHTDSRRAQFRSESRHAESFFNPVCTVSSIGRVKPTTGVDTADGEFAIFQYSFR